MSNNSVSSDYYKQISQMIQYNLIGSVSKLFEDSSDDDDDNSSSISSGSTSSLFGNYTKSFDELLQTTLKSNTESISNLDATVTFNNYDKNADGQLNADEFNQYLIDSKTSNQTQEDYLSNLITNPSQLDLTKLLNTDLEI